MGRPSPDHRQMMSGYYAWHSRIYDATRWAFLFDRDSIVDDLGLGPGETVVEVGCGTGRNLERIIQRVGPAGKVIALDCSTPMLARCHKRILGNNWRNVQLLDKEYGSSPVTEGKADALLMSYSLSMIPAWEAALDCALRELRPGGRIGVVDFCLERRTRATLGFARWMERNHVILDRPYRRKLSLTFHPIHDATRRAPGALWSFYSFVGCKVASQPFGYRT